MLPILFWEDVSIIELGEKVDMAEIRRITICMRNIPQRWADLEAWLSIHYKQLDFALRPGASPNKIEAIEKILGVTFPNDLKQFYLCHDGQTDKSLELFNGFQFLSLDQVVDEWSALEELDADLHTYELDFISDLEIKPVFWSRKWVPFTADGCGDYQCIDLDPNSAGKSGQIINMWHEDSSRYLESFSLSEWFEKFVNRVLNHEFHYSEDKNAFIEIDDKF